VFGRATITLGIGPHSIVILVRPSDDTVQRIRDWDAPATICVAGYGALGHVPLDFQQFYFFFTSQ